MDINRLFTCSLFDESDQAIGMASSFQAEFGEILVEIDGITPVKTGFTEVVLRVRNTG